jgi:S-adenosylmethionine hydrolase
MRKSQYLTWSEELLCRYYNDLQNAPNISEDEDNKKVIIVDETGNIIAQIDANGLKTTTVAVNNVNINGTDISDDGSGKVEFADENGNVIVQINDTGVKSIDFYVGDVSLKEKIHMWDSKSGFSGDYYDLYNKPSISEYKLDEFIITDFEGNIIGKFDKNGLKTTQINSDKIILNNEDLEEKIANIMDNEEL